MNSGNYKQTTWRLDILDHQLQEQVLPSWHACLNYDIRFILFYFSTETYLKSALCKRYTKQFQDNNARVTLISRKITARSVYVIDIDIGLGHRDNSLIHPCVPEAQFPYP